MVAVVSFFWVSLILFFVYNYERLQTKLNGLSPMEFRTKAA
ncbi:IS3 family transposase [Paenibacillus gansuensis]|uniref:IS3 family transposase n=1 Tax=Paenibacillus gansuensis TaxID=306542 RepID=A0ABW5P8N4_9BACL